MHISNIKVNFTLSNKQEVTMVNLKFTKKYIIWVKIKGSRKSVWVPERFLTGGGKFDTFAKGMIVVKKLRKMSSSNEYKLRKDMAYS